MQDTSSRSLYLIKHGAPEIRPDTPSHDWSLSERGCDQAWALGLQLASHDIAAVITSEEHKAIATGQLMAELLDVPTRPMLGLHEHLRYNQRFLGSAAEYDTCVQRFFAQPNELVMGDETADDAHRRFSVAVRAVMTLHDPGDVAIVAHGTVISLLAARANGIEPFPLWKRLGFCEYLQLEWPSLRMHPSTAGGGLRLVL